MTTGYVAPTTASKLFFNNANTFYVALGGSDTNGNDGSVDRPFRTLQFAVTTAASGDCILVGPGTFNESVNITKNLTISALVPGATNIDCATAATTTLTITGTVANQTLMWEGIGIANTDNTGTTSLALAVIGGAVAGTYVFKNCNIVGGSPTLNAGTAVSFTGNAGNGTILDIQSPSVIGGHYLNMLHAADQVIYRNCSFVCGPAIWMRIIGNAAGNVSVIASTLRGTTGTEYIEFGNGAATTAILNLISSKLNAYLRLNTTAAGYVTLEDSSVSYITPNQLSQIVRYVNGDYLRIALINADLDPAAPAAVTMYTVPGGRRFDPERVVTTNRGAAASGAALNYRYNGTGAGTVVGALGVAALPTGSTVNTVTQDSINAAGTIQFDIVAASGTDADRADATVYGRLV